MDDLQPTDVANMTGAQIDTNGVLISASEDGGADVAIAFRARRPDNNYRYIWLYKVRFGVPPISMQTKGDSITFSTPQLTGTVLRRNKPDENNNHPWKAEVVEGGAGVSASTITAWFTEVYEGVFGEGESTSTNTSSGTTIPPGTTITPGSDVNTGSSTAGTDTTGSSGSSTTGTDTTGSTPTDNTSSTPDTSSTGTTGTTTDNTTDSTTGGED
jgi:hypothetical protein